MFKVCFIDYIYSQSAVNAESIARFNWLEKRYDGQRLAFAAEHSANSDRNTLQLL
ncbi:MAG TPA: hypothetical protein IGS40_10350 [Trichormus sp. M33_DOE_039]|nr:hypothetical protein [Trichormus sp. M33_DOE_039]